MYYNNLLQRLVLDKLDYYLLGDMMVSYLTPRVKEYLLEKKKIKRLKKDLISKSRLIRSSSSNSG